MILNKYIRVFLFINKHCMTYLNDLWCVYFHNPHDYNWDLKSYNLISQINTVEDFVEVYKTFEDLFYNGMFFIMREHVTPRWEDDCNISGGCLSFKISKFEMLEKFFETCSMVLGETMGKNGVFSGNINGISLSPKRNYYIIRIWLKNSEYSSSNNYNIKIPKFSTIMYKNHYSE